MVTECRLKLIGTSKHILIPFQLIKKYELDKYVYYPEVENNGEKIIFSRMRKIEDNKK